MGVSGRRNSYARAPGLKMRLAYLENKKTKQTKLECATKWEIRRSKREGSRGRQGPVMEKPGGSGSRGEFWLPTVEWHFLVCSKHIHIHIHMHSTHTHTHTHINKVKQNTLAAAWRTDMGDSHLESTISRWASWGALARGGRSRAQGSASTILSAPRGGFEGSHWVFGSATWQASPFLEDKTAFRELKTFGLHD